MNLQRKTIWYCHHYAGSPVRGMSFRPFYLTREFIKAGLNAYVIGASFHHLQANREEQVNDVLLDESENIPFITLKTPAYEGNGLGRLRNMISYAFGFKRYLNKLISITGIPNVIIASSVHPFHYPVLEKIAKKYGAKIIFEVRDLWPLSLQHLLKMSSWHPLVVWLRWIEKRAYRRAFCIVSTLDNAFLYLKNQGVSPERFRFIPNGTSTSAYENIQPLSFAVAKKIEALKKSGQFLLGYAGAFGKPNALEYLIDAMAMLEKKKVAVHCILIGQGNLKTVLIEKAKSLRLSSITFFPQISKLEIPPFLSQMDALYLGWNEADIYQYGVSPNKIFDYMMAGKPIIESGGSPARMIEAIGCGMSCRAEAPQEIADCILKMSDLSKTERDRMGQKGRNHVKAVYEYANIARNYLDLF